MPQSTRGSRHGHFKHHKPNIPEHISSSLFQKGSSSDKLQSRRYRSPRSLGAAASAYLLLGTPVINLTSSPHPQGSQGFREPLCKGHYTSMSQLHTVTGYRNSLSCDIKIIASFSLLLVTSSIVPCHTNQLPWCEQRARFNFILMGETNALTNFFTGSSQNNQLSTLINMWSLPSLTL